MIEWEQDGDAAETMGEVLQDAKWPDFTRRRALLCRLYQLSTGDRTLAAANLATLADYLGRVEIYACLAPLEKTYEHDDPSVRAACLSAVRRLFFKRSFVLVTRALEDESEAVRKEALEVVEKLHFPHGAFDPLARIYRSSLSPEVRRAALGSIGHIPSMEAIEFLIDVLRHGDWSERGLAGNLLVHAEHGEASQILGRAVANETGATRQLIAQVLKQRRA